MELPTAFATLKIFWLTQSKLWIKDLSEPALSLHHSISYLFVLIHYYYKSETKNVLLFGSPSFFLEEFQGSTYVSTEIIYKTTSPPPSATAFNIISSVSWKESI